MGRAPAAGRASMSAARDAILGGIRFALKRGPLPGETAAALAELVAAHRRNLVPALSAALDHAGRIDLFVLMAAEVQTTVARVPSVDDVPVYASRYSPAEYPPAGLVI